ncbi:MAG: chorismate mutase [candidate division KSB1 bacterium]|nr:chorismate mutase [candidate division KSB1 bacterium]
MELAQLRVQVDFIDEQLVDLLNRRALLSLEIVKEKQRMGIPIYDAEREEQVLLHVQHLNHGPIDSDQLRLIFKQIIRACRTIEQTRKGNEYGHSDEEQCHG